MREQRQLPELPTLAPRRGQVDLLSDEIIQDWPGCTDPEHPAKLRDGGGLFLHQRVPQGQRIWCVRVAMPHRPGAWKRDDQEERDDPR
jgi:hypothetical protein